MCRSYVVALLSLSLTCAQIVIWQAPTHVISWATWPPTSQTTTCSYCSTSSSSLHSLPHAFISVKRMKWTHILFGNLCFFALKVPRINNRVGAETGAGRRKWPIRGPDWRNEKICDKPIWEGASFLGNILVAVYFVEIFHFVFARQQPNNLLARTPQDNPKEK